MELIEDVLFQADCIIWYYSTLLFSFFVLSFILNLDFIFCKDAQEAFVVDAFSFVAPEVVNELI